MHVSYDDAVEFCAHFLMRLPTEAEWEFAARGGLDSKVYPWGDDLMLPDGKHRTNIWQGDFPLTNTADDGFKGTAPAVSYEPNGFGLYNMVGNVWEWTATAHDADEMIIKGGSFLCHKSYCFRYRVAARSHNSRDSTTANLGFRCVKDVPQEDGARTEL